MDNRDIKVGDYVTISKDFYNNMNYDDLKGQSGVVVHIEHRRVKDRSHGPEYRFVTDFFVHLDVAVNIEPHGMTKEVILSSNDGYYQMTEVFEKAIPYTPAAKVLYGK